MWIKHQVVDPRRSHSWKARGAAVWMRGSSRIGRHNDGGLVSRIPLSNNKVQLYMCPMIYMAYLSIISVHLSVSPDTHTRLLAAEFLSPLLAK